DKVLTGGTIAPGDVILGLASSGVHSNGFSLVRRIIEQQGWDLERTFPSLGRSLGAALLEPTRIYVRCLLPLVQERRLKGLAHITGGGLLENIPRVIPEGCHATVDVDEWELPAIFGLLQQGGRIAPGEMARIFNCGIGMAAIVSPQNAEAVLRELEGGTEEDAYEIGRIEEVPRGCPGTRAWARTRRCCRQARHRPVRPSISSPTRSIRARSSDRSRSRSCPATIQTR